MRSRRKRCLKIVLPEEWADVRVAVVRKNGIEEVLVGLEPQQENSLPDTSKTDRFLLVWRQDDYRKISVDEVLWIEASGSYSRLHLIKNQVMVISYHLAVLEKQLPEDVFLRIHRSTIVNVKYIHSLVGNSFRVGTDVLTIGREYKERVFSRFIFLGVRRSDASSYSVDEELLAVQVSDANQ